MINGNRGQSPILDTVEGLHRAFLASPDVCAPTPSDSTSAMFSHSKGAYDPAGRLRFIGFPICHLRGRHSTETLPDCKTERKT